MARFKASATQAMVAKEEEAASQQATRDREFSDQTHEVRWDAAVSGCSLHTRKNNENGSEWHGSERMIAGFPLRR